jgi:17beta-estradiol 17-dehydrogenase / 3beta-hydroxysteroid 3-dehydrogenase
MLALMNTSTTTHGMARWAGKTALVTGASSGIGAAIAARLLAEGLRVVGCGRRQRAVAEVLTPADPGGGSSLALACDVRDETAVKAAFAAARERFGGVDVLVNNAGLGHAGPLAKGEVEQWREMLEVNVLGLCICTREALADMRARGDRGQIIHIGSMAGQRVPAGAGVYAATKHAVRALTESLRMELREAGDPIRVGEICPGFVETGFAAHYLKSAEKARETYSQFKVLEARDVAEAVVYMLACPDHVQVHDILMRPTEQPT